MLWYLVGGAKNVDRCHDMYVPCDETTVASGVKIVSQRDMVWL